MQQSNPGAISNASLPTATEEPPSPKAGGGLAGLEKLAHRIAVFQECSYDFVEAVILRMRKILCRPGQVIVEQGSESPQAMYMILWGQVDVTCQGQACATLAEGKTFGEAQMLGLFDRWSCSVTVTTDCMLCELTEAHLKEELKNYPEEAEYFKSIVDYYSIRNEEWTAREVRLSLRRSACLRQASEELLVELEKAMERRLLFAGDCLFTEGECSPLLGLAILYDGEVAAEVAGRVVWALEVPHVETRSVISEAYYRDQPSARGSAAQGEGGSLIDSGLHGRTLELSEEADAMLEKSLNLGPCRGASDMDLPEAAVFGEEVFMGTSRASTITVRARKMCDVRILHRQSLERVIAKYPKDAKMLAEQFRRDPDEVFPPLQDQDARLFGAYCEVSEDFVDFLKAHVEERVFFPGDHITFDSLNENLPKTAIVPLVNHTFGRLNVGHVRAILPQNADPLEGLRPNQILGPGSTIRGSWCWAGALFQALEVCYVSVTHRGCISRALEELALDRERVVPVLVKQHQDASQQQQMPTKVKSHKQDRVAKILRERSIFASASPAFLAEILQFGAIRVFMPGDRIIEQGADGSSMFILSVGIAHVVKESMEEVDNQITRTLTNIGGLTYGSVFGELVMLGVQSKRSASIVASSVCCTWEVQHKQILGILDRHPPERDNFLKLVEEHLDNLAAPRIIYHPLFAGFSQQFRTLVGVNCERKLYFPGEVLVREGSTGDRMYIVNLGSASVEVAGQHVMQIRGGSHIGFSMLTSSPDKEKHFATVVTETMCQVLMITRVAYQHALTQYPSMQVVAQQLEAEEKARTRKMLSGFMKLVQRRRGLRYIIDALRDGTLSSRSSEINSSNRPMLDCVFQGWSRQVQRHAELRREEEELRMFNDKQIETWLDKRKRLMENQRPQKELQRLLKRNLIRRGPLKMPLITKVPPLAKKDALLHETASAGMPPRGASTVRSQASLLHDGVSPYTAPAVVWRRVPQPLGSSLVSQSRVPQPLGSTLGSQSARTPRSLPPLQAA
eukprot:TRINITY_DN25404_c0_g1_i1.p1 TRINITY_DN25404_c0_g1~~TRINITY_DN25404_c0_g1_i1.p1  ORF type:complete len:1021 (+),score=193.95 TRINITY_DN25404_c0_g1_i1:96-3158(+)